MRHLPFFRLLPRFVIACLTLAFFTGLAHADALPPFSMPNVAPWPILIKPLPDPIEENDLPVVTARAKAGDTDAQLQLVSYYSEYQGSLYEPRDMAQAKAWARKAAEAGNDYARYAEVFLNKNE